MKITRTKGMRERVDFSRIQVGEFFEAGLDITEKSILYQRIQEIENHYGYDVASYNAVRLEDGKLVYFANQMVTRVYNVKIEYSHSKES